MPKSKAPKKGASPKLTPDMDDALKYLKEVGLGDIFNIFEADPMKPSNFFETHGKAEFFDMRLGELFLKADAKHYTIKHYDDLNPAQKQNMGKFIWEILVSNRIIKLYDDEYEKLSEITQTTLIENNYIKEQLKEQLNDYNEQIKRATKAHCKPINAKEN